MSLNLDPHKVKLLDCSASPNYPESTAGDVYTVSVAGLIGGASGIPVAAGDVILCITDSIGGTQASVGSSFLVQPNASGTPITLTGTNTLTAAQCTGGRKIHITGATGYVTTLPAVFAQMDCEIILDTAPTSGNHTVVTAASANIFSGGTVNRAGVAGSSDDDGDTISFVANQAISGDFVRLRSNAAASLIQVFGFSDVAAGLTITKAS